MVNLIALANPGHINTHKMCNFANFSSLHGQDTGPSLIRYAKAKVEVRETFASITRMNDLNWHEAFCCSHNFYGLGLLKYYL